LFHSSLLINWYQNLKSFQEVNFRTNRAMGTFEIDINATMREIFCFTILGLLQVV